jgi:hypothetical protein
MMVMGGMLMAPCQCRVSLAGWKKLAAIIGFLQWHAKSHCHPIPCGGKKALKGMEDGAATVCENEFSAPCFRDALLPVE